MTTYFSTRNNVLSFADINISQQNAVESRFFKHRSVLGKRELLRVLRRLENFWETWGTITVFDWGREVTTKLLERHASFGDFPYSLRRRGRIARMTAFLRNNLFPPFSEANQAHTLLGG